jgi:hypothetical protein
MRRREVKREPIRAPWCRSHRKMNTAAGDTFSPAEVGLRAYTNPPPPNWRRTDVETQQKDAQTHEAAAGEPCQEAEAVDDIHNNRAALRQCRAARFVFRSRPALRSSPRNPDSPMGFLESLEGMMSAIRICDRERADLTIA